MNAEYFRQLLHRQPFEPFAVHLSNGEIHAIRHPECANLTNTRLVVVDPEADRITVCSLLHVAGVEMLQSAAS
ncbi:MAG: hypothetical protein ACRELG_02515 [Gemmataceae bacterium]